MKYRLLVRPEAEAELKDAFDWYEQQVSGLGDQFLQSLEAIINSICKNPRQYPVVYRNVRRALLRRFPYQVFFVAEEDQIRLIAVFHGMRNPKRWRGRP